MRKSVFMIEGIQVAVASPEYWASRQGQKDQRELAGLRILRVKSSLHSRCLRKVAR
jgi:hypothetical protein